MKFKEIIKEGQGELDKYYQASLNGALTFPNMDQYYELYRFSVLTASADAHGGFATDATHVLRDHPMTVAYSKEEQQMVADTAKALGKKTQELTPHGSTEPKDTNITSPVATRREIWDLWGKSIKTDNAPLIKQQSLNNRDAHDQDRLHYESNTLENKKSIEEGWKEKAGALAAAACVAGTPGCATTGSSGNSTPNEIIPTLNAIDRISRITKPGMRELGAQELKDLTRGDKDRSVILRMLKKAEEDIKLEADTPPVSAVSKQVYYAIYTNGVPAVKYTDQKEAEQTVSKLKKKFPEYKFEIRLTESNHGKYWCSTDRRWKYRQSPKQSRKVSEAKVRSDVESSLPNAYVIDKLHNTDPYTQYRYGVALAAAKGKKQRDKEGSANEYGKESAWNQSFAVIDTTGTQEDEINDALAMVGLKSSDKRAITGKGSTETKDVVKASPVATRKELKDLYKK